MHDFKEWKSMALVTKILVTSRRISIYIYRRRKRTKKSVNSIQPLIESKVYIRMLDFLEKETML